LLETNASSRALRGARDALAGGAKRRMKRDGAVAGELPPAPAAGPAPAPNASLALVLALAPSPMPDVRVLGRQLPAREAREPSHALSASTSHWAKAWVAASWPLGQAQSGRARAFMSQRCVKTSGYCGIGFAARLSWLPSRRHTLRGGQRRLRSTAWCSGTLPLSFVTRPSRTTSRFRPTWSGSFVPTFDAACSRTASFARTATTVVMICSFPSRASTEASAQAAPGDAWPTPGHTLLTACCPMCPSDNTCSRSPATFVCLRH
jgi:hypothetical protein